MPSLRFFRFSGWIAMFSLFLSQPSLAQEEIFQDDFESGDPSAWTLFLPPLAESIESTLPAQAEMDVALTRETIITFRAPIDPASLGPAAVYAEGDEVPLPATLLLSTDGLRVTLFYDPPLPPGSEVKVFIEGDELRNTNGQNVDGNGDGHAGGLKVLTFHTLDLGTVPGTRVCGRVLASEPDEMGEDVPLEGVTVSVDGVEDVYTATTDGLGNYCLDPAPSERFFVHIDGAPAVQGVPSGAYYPTVGKAFEPKPGLTHHVGTSYLPLIAEDTLQPVSEKEDVSIALPPEVIAAQPELAGAELVIPAGSLFFDDLQPGTSAGLAPVPADRLPGNLPADLDFPVVFTVQTEGANNLDLPAPICFPNLPQPATGVPLPAGSEQSLISFDHDAGRWRAVGGMTVTPDATRICSNDGAGIVAPGWHLPSPPPVFPPPPPIPTPPPGPHPPHDEAPPAQDPPSDPPEQPEEPDPPCNGGSAAACSDACSQTQTICGYTMVGIGFGCTAALAAAGPSFGLSLVVGAYCAFGTGAAGIHGCGNAAESCQSTCDATCGGSFHGSSSSPSLGRSAELRALGGDPILNQLVDLSNQIAILVAPYTFSGLPMPPEIEAQIFALVDQAETVAGGDPIEYVETVTSASWPSVDQNLPTGNSPHYPILYMAEYLRNDGVVTVERGETRPYGQFTLFPAIRADLQRIRFYDPYTHATGVELPVDLGGGLYGVSRIQLYAVDDTQISDLDGDTLADEIEVIYGSNPRLADTDGDGADDRTEVIQGTDLLGRDIDVGEVVSNQLAFAGETDRYTLAVQAGQSLFFDIQNGGGGGKDWTLLAPDGSEIFASIFSSDLGTVGLADGGAYKLLIFDGANTATGSYQFQLWDVPAPDAFAIAIGDAISDDVPGPGAGTIETPGVLDVYTFIAAPGQEVFFDVQAGASGAIDWWLLDGAENQIFRSSLSDEGVVQLDAGGAYTLTVGDSNNDYTGTYGFQLWDVPAPESFAIAIGDIISDGVPGAGAGNIETPGVFDVYTFTASAGQRIYFDVQSGATGSVDWRLFDASENQIFTSALNDVDVLQLDTGGTYTLRVGDTNNDHVETYQFQLWNVPDPDIFAISIGDIVSDGVPGPGAGHIETPGVLDVYTFTATAGQRVFFDVQAGATGQIDWRLVDAADNQVFKAGFSDRDVVQLEAGGLYTLTVGAEDDDRFGTYQFQLWDVPAPDTFAIAIGDVISDGVPGPGAGHIESPGVLDVYTFTGTAGQEILFDIQAGANGATNWRLEEPGGAIVFDRSFSGDRMETLTATGTYTLTIGAEDDDYFGTYQIELQLQ